MIYTGTILPNTSNTGLQNREPGRVTYINDCLPFDAFKESRCTPRPQIPGSLQSWSKTCYKFVTHYDDQGIPSGSSLHEYRRDGYCRIEEICVNSFATPIAGKRGQQVAMCIAQSDFLPPFDRSKNGIQRFLDAMLGAVRGSISTPKQPKTDGRESSGGSRETSSGATISVSQVDGQTPINADTLNLAAWNGDRGQVEEAGAPQSHKCRDCTDLEVARLASDTNHLKLEARMLMTGTMAGILWIAILSG